MNKTTILGALAISTIIGTAGVATAQDRPKGDRPNHSVERFMMIYDTNSDGTVDQTEISAEQKRLFGAVDVDGDGKLSVAEFRRRGRLLMRAGGATLFDMLDANGDQQVTVDELHGPKARWLKRYNTDGVAGLGAEELATALPGRQRGYHKRKRR